MSERHHIGFISTKLASWIAIVAILFSALAPTIAHAFPSEKTIQTLSQELCTAQGIKFVANNAIPGPADKLGLQTQTQPSSQDKMGMQYGHCLFCFKHAGSVGLPPATASFVFTVTGKTIQLAESYIAPVLPPHYQSANPSQAPPSL